MAPSAACVGPKLAAAPQAMPPPTARSPPPPVAKAKATTRTPEEGRAVATPATAAVPLASRATSLAPPEPRFAVREVARLAPILALTHRPDARP